MQKTVEITPEVRDVLARGEWAGWLFRLPPGQLDRPLYEAVNKVLAALGGKWHRGHQGHMFSLDGKPALVEALRVGFAVDQKRTLEQFWTPPDIARRLCDLAGDIKGLDVLEPSAGDGQILFEIIGRGAFPTAVEIDEGLVLQLVSETEGRVPIYGGNFLSWKPRPPETPAAFDRAIMNPPFSRGQDMAHVRRAFGLIKPGGMLVSVMSPHWVFATDSLSNAFRGWLSQMGDAAYDWVELPPGSFKSADTAVNSGILTVRKEQ